jgi:hypothetical protein
LRAGAVLVSALVHWRHRGTELDLSTMFMMAGSPPGQPYPSNW